MKISSRSPEIHSALVIPFVVLSDGVDFEQRGVNAGVEVRPAFHLGAREMLRFFKGHFSDV